MPVKALNIMITLLLMISVPQGVNADDGWFTLLLENDSVVDTDRDYSAGTALSYLWPSQRTPEAAGWVARNLLAGQPEDRVHFGVSLGQSIFTPIDKANTDFVANQQPYAAWLRLGARVLNVRPDGAVSQVKISVGVVGPEALGRTAQNTTHRVLGIPRALGWRNQLDSEPTFQTSWEHHFTPLNLINRQDGQNATRLVFVPVLGLDLGTVHVQTKAGMTLKLGKFRHGARPEKMVQGFLGAPMMTRRDQLGWFVFAGIDIHATAHTLFLDGGTFRQGPSLPDKTVFAAVTIGGAIAWQHAQLSFSLVDRTREYAFQARGHRFGVLTLSARF